MSNSAALDMRAPRREPHAAQAQRARRRHAPGGRHRTLQAIQLADLKACAFQSPAPPKAVDRAAPASPLASPQASPIAAQLPCPPAPGECGWQPELSTRASKATVGAGRAGYRPAPLALKPLARLVPGRSCALRDGALRLAAPSEPRGRPGTPIGERQRQAGISPGSCRRTPRQPQPRAWTPPRLCHPSHQVSDCEPRTHAGPAAGHALAFPSAAGGGGASLPRPTLTLAHTSLLLADVPVRQGPLLAAAQPHPLAPSSPPHPTSFVHSCCLAPSSAPPLCPAPAGSALLCRDAYLPGVQALARSLRLVQTRYPLIVMYTRTCRWAGRQGTALVALWRWHLLTPQCASCPSLLASNGSVNTCPLSRFIH